MLFWVRTHSLPCLDFVDVWCVCLTVSSCVIMSDVPSLGVCFQEEDFLPPGSTMSRHVYRGACYIATSTCYMSIDAGGFHVLFVDLSTLIDIYEIKEVGELLSLDGTGFSDHIDVSLSSTVSGCWTVPWNPLEIHAEIQPAWLATIKSYKIHKATQLNHV